MAASYTAGMLMAVSQSLPPLLQGPGIINDGGIAAVNPGQDNTIRFTLLDNRTAEVKYRLVVDNAGSSDDIISLSSQTATLEWNNDQTSLPWLGVETLTWNGKLASGSPIRETADGLHTLFITGTDWDGNPFTDSLGQFTLNGPPSLTVTTPKSTPYAGFRGIAVSSVCPAVLNPEMYGGSLAVWVSANGSPVAQLTVKRPGGAVTPFDHPAENSPLVLLEPADGRYEATAVDEEGNRTFAPFCLGTLEAAATEGSRMTGYDKLGARLEYRLTDVFPLEKAELFDSAEGLVRADALSGEEAVLTYNAAEFADTENFTRDFTLNPASVSYTLRVQNKEGHIRENALTLAGASQGLTGPAEWFAGGGILDLSSEAGFLPGALGVAKPWAPTLGVEINSAMAAGPVVITQHLGSLTLTVISSGTPELAGLTPQPLYTRNYSYSVWNASFTVPQNCVMEWGAQLVGRCQDGTLAGHDCDSGLLCHTDAIASPVALGRYLRLDSSVQPAELTGVFEFLCDAKDPETGVCVSGRQPRLTNPLTVGLEAWGVKYSSGVVSLSGGLGAVLPAGDNVTVKLADWLSLTFERVTSPGYVSASILTDFTLPGVRPLRALGMQAAGAVYTGNIGVAIKYDVAGLTAGQLSYMEALKINNAASRDFIRLPVSKAGGTALFNTASLGEFMLEVPPYPTPYQYASGGLPGTPQGLGLLAGEPFTVNPVAPGSPEEQDLRQMLGGRGLVTAGDAYVIGPTGQKFGIAAAVRMAYDKGVIAAKHLRKESLGIYQVSEDGSNIARLGNSVLDMAKGELSAEVSELHSIFVIAGSTEPAPPAVLSPDVTAPESNIAFGIPAYESGGLVMISSASPVFVDAYDPQVPGRITTGVSTTYYLVDESPESCTEAPTLAGPPGTCQNPIYTIPFMLPAGIHTVWHMSDDRAGNKETVESKILYVDGDAPQVAVSANGQDVVSGGNAYITDKDSITITGLDPALSGPASGVGMMVFDISTTPCAGFMDYPQSPGDCRKILYTGPFSLPVGTHTIYYTAMDNVGNVAAIKSAYIEVATPVVLTSIAVNPSLVFVQAGGTQQFTAAGNFSDGSSRSLEASVGLLWTVAHSTVASITPEGLVPGVSYGITQVKATSGNLSAEASLFVYDPAPAAFSTTGSMLAGRHMHTGTVLRNHKVLVTGGNNGGYIYLASAELYDPVSGTFESAPSMNSPRGRAHAATLLLNGKVLVTGGDNGTTAVSSAELYDPVENRFLSTGSMAVARNYHTSTLLPDGRVLIAGGSDETGASVAVAELYDPNTNTFSTTGAMSVGRHIHAASLLANGKVLITGGYTRNGPASSAEIYDPATGKFSATGSMRVPRAYLKTVLLWSGKVLVTGGSNNGVPVFESELYDPASGLFSATGSMTARRLGGHTATLLPNGKVLAAGGDEYGDNNALSTAEVYDPATGIFTPTAFMGMSRIYHAAALLLPNGRVLICGGYNGSASVTSAELYNFGFGVPRTLDSIRVSPAGAIVEPGGTQQFTATGYFSDSTSRELAASDGLSWAVEHDTVAVVDPNGLAEGRAYGKTRVTVSSGSVIAGAALTVTIDKFSATGSMLAGRHMHTATLLRNHKVLVTGGNDGGYIYLASAELYDPVSGTFDSAPAMNSPRGRAHAATLLLNGKVLVTGGDNGTTAVSSAELYDPVNGIFSNTDSMSVARNYHTSTLLPDGRVLIAGGSDETGASVAAAELYDPNTDTFSTTGAMSVGRHIHAAVLLPNGKVLITGGYSNGGPASSAEIYDPATGKFSATGSLGVPRSYLKMVLLWNGKVLVTGGSNNGVPVFESELYDPATGLFFGTGSMNARRLGGHTATLLPDGKVLAAGGDEYGNNNALYTAEVYDPDTGIFTPTAPMGMGRIFHAAALLLPNGRVLICGGYNGSASVASAELYDSGFRGSLSPIPASIVLAPADAGIVAGGKQQFTATANFSDATSRVLGAADGLVWSIAHSTVAVVGDDGLASGVAYGRTRVSVGYGIFSTEAGLSVAKGVAAPLSMTVTPETITEANSHANVEYELSEPGHVTLEVLSGAAPHSKLGTIYAGDLQAAGVHSVQWSGKGANDAVLGDGEYILRITIADGLGNVSAPLDRTVHIDNYPLIQAIIAKPASFNPSSGEKVRFLFSVSEVSTLNLAVKDGTGATIKQLAVDSISPAGSLSFYWDGRDNSAQIVPPSAYSITVDVVDKNGNQAEASGGNCEVLSPEYPAITGLAETPDPFYADTAENTVAFSYHLTAVSQTSTVFPVTVRIRHPVLGIIKTIALEQGQGNRSVQWDGMSDAGTALNGQPAPDGAYSEEVSVIVDGMTAKVSGAFSLLRNNTVAAQSSGPEPVVTVQYDAPDAQVTITQDPPLTTTVSAALVSQTLSGNILASPIFDIVASQVFATQPVLRFKYNPAYDGESLVLSKYSVLTGEWVQVSSSYFVDLANNEVIITLNPDVFMGSLFALMQVAKGVGDSGLPVSTISAGKPSFEAFGLKVITPRTPVTVTARDEGEGASGVDKIYCAVDSGAFAEYTVPFAVAAQGEHAIKCRAEDKAGNAEAAKELRVIVMPLEDEAVEAAEGLTVTGTADVIGAARANAVISLNGNAKITGDVTASDVILTGKAAVTGLVAKTADTLVAEPITLGPLAQAAAAANNNSLVPAQYLQNGSLQILSKVRLELPAGTYYFKGIEISGGASVVFKETADVMVEGPVSVSGGAELNAEGPASRLKLFVNSELPVILSGGGKAAAYVYAPKSALKLAGNVLAGGHWFARSVDLSGTGNMIQSGETLPRSASRFKATSFTPMADATFRLGEVYVFPNPAKGAEVPVFHIETGIADSVKITIYTISGRMAHEYTLAGLPPEIDDGNGLSYAYEYAWRDHIPSGVYLYYIEAQKAGQKLKKIGKFAVVR